MREYKHTVHYYETDKMQVVHHSNYIRWMEEARVAYLSDIGWSFVSLEESGIVSPVVSVSCNYKQSCRFADEVTICTSVSEVKGAKLIFDYIMKNLQGETICQGTTVHCFTKNGIPLRIKKDMPEFYEILESEKEG